MSLPAPAPFVQPEIKAFWEATSRGQLLLPRCRTCAAYVWFPRPYCPQCGSLDVDWLAVSGRGTVYSYTVNRRGQADLAAYAEAGTYVLAYVELAEGPRVMTNIVECEPEAVRVGLEVELVFHDTGAGNALFRFRPR